MSPEPWRWQRPDGSSGLTPAEYFRLGQLGAIAPRLLDLAREAGWLDDLHATPAEVAALDQALAAAEEEGETAMYDSEDELGRELDEAGGDGYGPWHDQAGTDYGLSNTYDLANDGPVTSAIEAGQRAGMDRVAMTRYARVLALSQYRQDGDLHGLVSAYSEPGMLAGHRIELANAPADDALIELARSADGRFGSLCSAPDAFGRCSGRFHDPSCTHSTAIRAATGSAAEAEAWNASARNRAAGIADHVLASAGERRPAASPFERDRQGREAVVLPCRARLADPNAASDDPWKEGMPLQPVPPAVAAMAAREGLASPSAGRARERYRAARAAELARRQQRAAGLSGAPRLRPEHPGAGAGTAPPGAAGPGERALEREPAPVLGRAGMTGWDQTEAGLPDIGELTAAGPERGPEEISGELRRAMGEGTRPPARRDAGHPDVRELAEELGLR